MAIKSIVSGGQTGADRGGLKAALHCNVPHGGWCPMGRKSEDGRIPDSYRLKEMSSADYLKRTEQNVIDSDVTVIFTLGEPTGGSLKTIDYAKKHKKPWLHIDVDRLSRKEMATAIVAWVADKNHVLNVAGSRESKADGIEDLVHAVMVDVLIAGNPECRKFYPVAG